MKICRFYTRNGESYFEDIELPITRERKDAFGNLSFLSNSFQSPTVTFGELPATLNQDWHNAPVRQVVIIMAGVMEISVRDGESRRWGAGEMFFADDVTGRGHKTRAVEGPIRIATIRLPEGFDHAKWSA